MVNVGSADRALRFIAGFILILLSFLPSVSQSIGGWSWALLRGSAFLFRGGAKQTVKRLQNGAHVGACEAVIDGLAIAARLQQALGAHFGEVLA